MGDPARDLGSFLARVDVQALDGELDANAATRAREAVVGGYACGARLPPGIAAQHARALLTLLPEGFRQRRADWPERMTAILERAEAVLAPQSRSVPTPGAGTNTTADPLDPLLQYAVDPARIGPEIARAVGLPDAPHLQATLLRRKVGRRALIRYSWVDGGQRTALVGKLRAKGPDQRTPRLHARLRIAGLDGAVPDWVGVPRAVGEIGALHVWLQEEVRGLRVTDYLRPDSSPRPAARAGEALAKLHTCGVEGRAPWTLGDEGVVLERVLTEAAAALPAQADRIGALLCASRALIAALGDGPSAGIHRDWYPDQVLVDGEVVWILDLDLHAQGDPAIDVGNFAAHIRELAIRRHGDPFALAAHERAFLDGYAAGGGRPDRVRIECLRALSLARLVGVSLRIPDRRPATNAILDAAERLVQEAAQSLCVPAEP
jgi:aminoglycoside phosphotransferase (APT) family kinase protein